MMQQPPNPPGGSPPPYPPQVPPQFPPQYPSGFPQGAPPPYPPPAPPRRSSPWPWIFGCLALVLLTVGLIVAAAVLGWSRFSQWGIESDLSDYQRAVENSQLAQPVKTRLLGRIRNIRARHKQKPIGFPEWVDYSDLLDDLTGDGTVTEDEVEKMERELGKIESGTR